jgi:uncharacterized protein YukE
MAVLGDPTTLEALAARYERHADCVNTAGRRLHNAAHNSNWQCDAADRFRANMQQSNATGADIANEMYSMAQHLRTLAQELRDEIAELAAIEARVRQLIAEMRTATAPPWAGTPWHPANLPPSFDSTWRTVGRALGC